jgi:CubicO group peptidase (beta-lactamase class C family)
MTTHLQLQPSTPETQGISSSAILAWVEAAEKHLDSLHSFMLLRHGYVVAEGWWSPYGPEHPHQLFSLTKSFTSTAVGLAVAEGRLSVDDLVLSFFPERAPAEAGEHLQNMRVRHLLTMTTGHEEEPTFHLFEREDGDWVKGFLEHPVARPPGTHFVYNSSASHVLSAIVQQVTGMPVLDYLQPRLFAPLGIEKPAWDTCPRGINTGGWGLSLKTEDVARFGQLCLQKGDWRGQSILPATWVEEATAGQVSNAPNENPDWEQGYGYQFWRCRHDAYRGDGAFGQFCLVMPDRDAVLAITSGIGDMQAVLNVVWEVLLPAFSSVPLAENSAAQEKLGQKLASLALPPVQGQPFSPLAARVSGSRYAFEANEGKLEAVAFDFVQDGCAVSIWDDRGEHQLVCGSGAWIAGETTLDATAPRKVAASGAWTAEDTYEIKLCLYETPFRPAITCRFTEDRLTYDFKANVAFGPLERPQLVGRKATLDD